MAAALVEFAEQGMAGARMDAIAAAAGVNKALLYYYFRSKDELYAAVLDEFFQRLDARIARALDSAPVPVNVSCFMHEHTSTPWPSRSIMPVYSRAR